MVLGYGSQCNSVAKRLRRGGGGRCVGRTWSRETNGIEDPQVENGEAAMKEQCRRKTWTENKMDSGKYVHAVGEELSLVK